MSIRILYGLLFVSSLVFAQKPHKFEDLQAIKNRDITFYNIGSYSISSETYSTVFDQKKIKKHLRKYKIRWKKNEVLLSDSLISAPNYKFIKKFEDGGQSTHFAVFALKNDRRTSIITFSSLKSLDEDLMRSFVNHFLNPGFPEEIYVKPEIDSIKFVNRYIRLGRGCRWMGVRNVQCPYNGQMDWTVHSTLEEAKSVNAIRAKITKDRKQLKLLSEESVEVLFEGKEVVARKFVFDVKGLNSLLLSLQSGAKNLIVYYIVQEIDGRYVSCILSHWDNDRIQPHGLPALLGEVMTIPNK